MDGRGEVLGLIRIPSSHRISRRISSRTRSSKSARPIVAGFNARVFVSERMPAIDTVLAIAEVLKVLAHQLVKRTEDRLR